MNKKIILLTRRFPYFTTESFLESEIFYLANFFEEVVIFPTEISNKKRTIPRNVKVVDDLSLVFGNKAKRLFLTIFSSTFYKSIFLHLGLIRNFGDLKLILKYSSAYLAYFKFFSTSKEVKDADLVYTYWFNEAPLALSELKREKRFRFKVISRAHRYDLYEGVPSTPTFWVNRERTLNLVDCVFPISENGKLFFETKYPSAKAKLKVSKLGVHDNGKYSPKSQNGRFSIVSVSRVHPMKRIDLILDCVVAFSKMIPSYQIIWTHFGDGDKLSELDIKAKSIAPSNLEIQFRGNVPNSLIYDYYANCPTDIFINLSSSEGIPVSIMEAQSFGIPVVATNVGGTGEIVTSESGYLLTENPSIEDVVNALDSILLHKSINSYAVKAYWKNNYDAERNYMEFCMELLKFISE